MNCPGLTPLAPRAGPMGGAGVAVPPGACILNFLTTSLTFAISLFLRSKTSKSKTNTVPTMPREKRRQEAGHAACSAKDQSPVHCAPQSARFAGRHRAGAAGDALFR